jgi:predicted porin
MAARKDKREATSADPANGSLLALGANYALSKRTTAYGRFESLDTNKADDTNGKGRILAIGVRHAF